MLILSRKKGESIVIGNNIEIQIIEVQGEQVKVGINAPKHIAVHRKEIYNEIQQENKRALMNEDIENLKGIIKKKEK